MTDTLTETTVATLSIPAASIPDNGVVVVNYSYTITSYNAGAPGRSLTVRAKFDGTTVFSNTDVEGFQALGTYTGAVSVVNAAGTLKVLSAGSSGGSQDVLVSPTAALTGDLTVLITLQWSEADTDNSAVSVAAAAWAYPAP